MESIIKWNSFSWFNSLWFSIVVQEKQNEQFENVWTNFRYCLILQTKLFINIMKIVNLFIDNEDSC